MLGPFPALLYRLEETADRQSGGVLGPFPALLYRLEEIADRAEVCLGLSQLYYTVLRRLLTDDAEYVCLGLSQLYYTVLRRL